MLLDKLLFEFKYLYGSKQILIQIQICLFEFKYCYDHAQNSI